jgi:hypothetical protein
MATSLAMDDELSSEALTVRGLGSGLGPSGPDGHRLFGGDPDFEEVPRHAPPELFRVEGCD